MILLNLAILVNLVNLVILAILINLVILVNLVILADLMILVKKLHVSVLDRQRVTSARSHMLIYINKKT